MGRNLVSMTTTKLYKHSNGEEGNKECEYVAEFRPREGEGGRTQQALAKGRRKEHPDPAGL